MSHLSLSNTDLHLHSSAQNDLDEFVHYLFFPRNSVEKQAVISTLISHLMESYSVKLSSYCLQNTLTDFSREGIQIMEVMDVPGKIQYLNGKVDKISILIYV